MNFYPLKMAVNFRRHRFLLLFFIFSVIYLLITWFTLLGKKNIFDEILTIDINIDEYKVPINKNENYLKDIRNSMLFTEKASEITKPVKLQENSGTKPAIIPTFKTNTDTGDNDEVVKQLSMLRNLTATQTHAPVPTNRPKFVLDTSGCKIAKLNPWDPTVIEFIKVTGPYKCSDYPQFLMSEPHGIIYLDAAVLNRFYNSSLDDIDCWYQGIKRKHEEPGNIRENDYYRTDVRKLNFNTPIDEDYIVVRCFFENNRTHEQFIPLVRLREKPQEKIPKVNRPLNVILLGVDSVSSLNFERHFQKTKAFLRNKIKPFIMNGYTKVGDNTFPNLVPMLTGKFVEDIWNETMKDTFYFDNVSFIWKEYSRYGYRTFYAEDMPYSGTFNYLKRGFRDPPTDYYYRPMALAMENSEAFQKAKEDMTPCINFQLETDIMYDYLKNFVETMGSRPHFAFCMVSTLTHDDINYASFADKPLQRLLKELDNIGAFNDSVIAVFSDHGIRFGDIRQTYIGKLEERLPFMYIHAPKWFLSKYPSIARNLKINQNRLITLFDIHATMKHILHLEDGLADTAEEMGLSLFNEIPENRTCEDANIKPHYCPCNDYVDVSVNDSSVQKLSQILVDHLNNLLDSHSSVCTKMELSVIKDARLGYPNKNPNNNLPMAHTVMNYLITLKVKPSSAIFEATVQHNAVRNETTVLGISRLNMYGKQSWCIDSQVLKLYCYCKTQPP